MSKAKVAHIVNSVGFGGVTEAVYQMLQALSPSYDLSVLFLRPKPDQADEEKRGRLQRFVDLGVPLTFLEPGTAQLAAVGRVAEWLQCVAPNIVHTHSYRPNLIGRLAASLASDERPLLVAHYQNQYDDKWAADGTACLDRRLGLATDRFIACSMDVRAHISDRLGIPKDAIDVVWNGVHCERFRSLPSPDDARSALGLPRNVPIIGLVGRVCPQKGQDLLVRACAVLVHSFPDLILAFAGSADDQTYLRELRGLIEQLGLQGNVRFFGHLDDIPTFYAAIDVLAAPSRWEGFGIMLAEAMSAGTPIVASNAGAIPEVIGASGAGLLFNAGDVEALADKLALVLRDGRLSDQLITAGRTRARDFSWANAGERVSAIYRSLLQDRSTRLDGGGP